VNLKSLRKKLRQNRGIFMMLNIKAQDMLKVLSDSGIHLNDAKAVVYDLLVRSNTTLSNDSLYINIEASELCTVMADSGLEEHESKAIIFDLIVLSENNKKVKNVPVQVKSPPPTPPQVAKETLAEPKEVEPKVPDVSKIRRVPLPVKGLEEVSEEETLQEEEKEKREEAVPRINRRKQVSFSAFGGDAVELRNLPRNM